MLLPSGRRAPIQLYGPKQSLAFELPLGRAQREHEREEERGRDRSARDRRYAVSPLDLVCAVSSTPMPRRFGESQ